MPQVSRSVVKSYFNTGDTPTEAQFADFIDSLKWFDESSGSGGDIVSAKQFGVIGDGAADETAGLLAGVNYTVANDKTLYIPAGTYISTHQTYDVPTGKKLRVIGDGNNTIIKRKDDSITGNFQILFNIRANSTAINSVVVKDIFFDGNLRNQTFVPDKGQCAMLKVQAAGTGTIENVLIENVHGYDSVADFVLIGPSTSGIPNIKFALLNNIVDEFHNGLRASIGFGSNVETIIMNNCNGINTGARPFRIESEFSSFNANAKNTAIITNFVGGVIELASGSSEISTTYLSNVSMLGSPSYIIATDTTLRVVNSTLRKYDITTGGAGNWVRSNTYIDNTKILVPYDGIHDFKFAPQVSADKPTIWKWKDVEVMYDSPLATLLLQHGSGAAATGVISGGGVTSYNVTLGGSNYVGTGNPPTVVVTGDGTGATAHAIVTGGIVTAVIPDLPGAGYTFATVVFSVPVPVPLMDFPPIVPTTGDIRVEFTRVTFDPRAYISIDLGGWPKFIGEKNVYGGTHAGLYIYGQSTSSAPCSVRSTGDIIKGGGKLFKFGASNSAYRIHLELGGFFDINELAPDSFLEVGSSWRTDADVINDRRFYGSTTPTTGGIIGDKFYFKSPAPGNLLGYIANANSPTNASWLNRNIAKREEFVRVTTVNYTVGANDVNILYDFAGGGGTFTLPPIDASNDKRVLYIKNPTSGSINTNLNLYDNNTTFVTAITTTQSVKLVYDNTAGKIWIMEKA